MKEEIKNLKDIVNKYKGLREAFYGQRLTFQWGVDVQKDSLDIQEFIDFGADSYENAKLFEKYYPAIATIDDQIKEQYPNYNLEERLDELKKLFKEELKVVNDLDTLEINSCNYFDVIVDNYYLYESNNFSSLKQQEEQLEQLKQEMNKNVIKMFGQSKEAVQHVGAVAVEKAKPYGKVAKKGFGEAKKATKSVVHKGSKKLIKVLKKVEEKTK